ncbi:uncharacterized protein EV422DRAFT_503960 [Fimicolochytrium jonesii]|uniref:uncharacterized protein n=1 Tax=Fimicolochytrium jonesii TaxID=1396493 RepID=UPI0022FE4A1A|nr:uncharacterized protein EV422DRAFT_503960 [Fimicolochytrium jonesii]KAI8825230.1 hypothetical protein EV422DRAFT_503960 [Fimicolochytrium jonesii]
MSSHQALQGYLWCGIFTGSTTPRRKRRKVAPVTPRLPIRLPTVQTPLQPPRFQFPPSVQRHLPEAIADMVSESSGDDTGSTNSEGFHLWKGVCSNHQNQVQRERLRTFIGNVHILARHTTFFLKYYLADHPLHDFPDITDKHISVIFELLNNPGYNGNPVIAQELRPGSRVL